MTCGGNNLHYFFRDAKLLISDSPEHMNCLLTYSVGKKAGGAHPLFLNPSLVPANSISQSGHIISFTPYSAESVA